MAPSQHATRLAERLDGVVALDLTVVDADEVIPGLRSIELEGDLAGFDPWPGQDLMVSVPPGSDTARWRRYTLRHVDRDAGRLELWVTTATDGPGAAWALDAAPGDHVDVVGPRGKIAVTPGVVNHVFCVDESGLAAAAAMGESIEGPARVVHFALLLPDPEWAPDDTIAPSCQGGVACMRNVLDASDLDSALSTVKSTLARLDPSTAAAYVFGELRLTRRFTELFAALGFAPERVASKPYWRDDRANEANGEPDRDAG
jgi:NADPH-dependent ferric siderophore reductase